MSGQVVTVENFARAETDRMFATLVAQAGGVNRLHHNRVPTPLDDQPVIRMNRDTLYSFGLVDITAGATVTVPDTGDRYASVMIVNQDHFVNRIFHGAGKHELDVAELDTPYVGAAVRVLVDPNDDADVAAVGKLQDQFGIEAGSARPFGATDYDTASLDATRNAILELGRHISSFHRAFGKRSEVDPVAHLIGSAAGWGGLPTSEALYLNVDPGLPVGSYRLRVGDVPVDGFWSISMYDADGFFPNTGQPVSVNNITADRDADGSITVHLGDWEPGTPNRLPVSEGWNYLVRLYRPRPEVLDGTWTFPTIET
jgi:hypothetical protein